MVTYQYVEDYLELLAGYDPSNAGSILYPTVSTPFSLARYDVQIIESMSVTTLMGSALTDRQGELACKLVLKYRRQFNKLGVDVTPVEHPVYRMPLRTIDRSKNIWLDTDRITVKFPYDGELIKQMQKFRNESQGSANFDRDKKVWHLAITEYNVNWVVTWGQTVGIPIDVAVIELFDQVIACENKPYAIKLVRDGACFKITNAAESLVDYVNRHLGGFGLENVVKLVDHAGVLGYTVDDYVVRPSLLDCFIDRNTYIAPNPGHQSLDMIFNYAEMTNRYPICIYDPTLEEFDLSRFAEEDIVRFDRNGKTKTSEYDPYDVKVIYARKIPTKWNFPVPLLITTFEMMYGGRKMDWTQRAEKIIYYGTTNLRNSNGSGQTDN